MNIKIFPLQLFKQYLNYKENQKTQTPKTPPTENENNYKKFKNSLICEQVHSSCGQDPSKTKCHQHCKFYDQGGQPNRRYQQLIRPALHTVSKTKQQLKQAPESDGPNRQQQTIYFWISCSTSMNTHAMQWHSDMPRNSIHYAKFKGHQNAEACSRTTPAQDWPQGVNHLINRIKPPSHPSHNINLSRISYYCNTELTFTIIYLK